VVGEATDSKASVGGQADIDKLTTTAGLLAAGISPKATYGTRIHISITLLARTPVWGMPGEKRARRYAGYCEWTRLTELKRWKTTEYSAAPSNSTPPKEIALA